MSTVSTKVSKTLSPGSNPGAPATIRVNRDDMIPNIEIYTGPMFSGKSDALIDSYEYLVTNGYRVAAFQSDKNTRNPGVIASRNGRSIPAKSISSTHEIDGSAGFNAYLFDEFQFFDNPEVEIKHVKSLVRNLGKTVVIGTLDYDYKGEEWAAFTTLQSLHTSKDLYVRISELAARCDTTDCTSDARFTALLNNGVQVFEGEQVIVDGPEPHYSPRCGDHFEALKMNPQPTL